MTILEIIREVAKSAGRADVPEDEAEFILWSYTGYPCFWTGPGSPEEPEECLRRELAEYFADPVGVAKRIEEGMRKAAEVGTSEARRSERAEGNEDNGDNA